MKIGILMLRHAPTRTSPIMTEVVRLLREWTAEVDVIYPEEQCTRIATLRPTHDLYVLKSASDLALSYAGALHAAGAAVLNPYPSVALLRDRARDGQVGREVRRVTLPRGDEPHLRAVGLLAVACELVLRREAEAPRAEPARRDHAEVQTGRGRLVRPGLAPDLRRVPVQLERHPRGRSREQRGRRLRTRRLAPGRHVVEVADEVDDPRGRDVRSLGDEEVLPVVRERGKGPERRDREKERRPDPRAGIAGNRSSEDAPARHEPGFYPRGAGGTIEC